MLQFALIAVLAKPVAAEKCPPYPQPKPPGCVLTRLPNVAQAADEREECWEDSRVKVCSFFRNGKLIYTTRWNKETGEVTLVYASQAKFEPDPSPEPNGTGGSGTRLM